MSAITERRCVCLRFNYEFLNELSERLGSYPSWSLAGGINLTLIVWIMGYLVVDKQLPEDAVPTWCWPDPACGAMGVMVFSSEFEEVPEGTMVPDKAVFIDAPRLKRVVEEHESPWANKTKTEPKGPEGARRAASPCPVCRGLWIKGDRCPTCGMSAFGGEWPGEKGGRV